MALNQNQKLTIEEEGNISLLFPEDSEAYILK